MISDPAEAIKGGKPTLPARGGGGNAAVGGGGKFGISSGGGAGKAGLEGGGNPKVATGGGMLELNTPGTGGGGRFVLSGEALLDLGTLESTCGDCGNLGSTFTGGGNSNNPPVFLMG